MTNLLLIVAKLGISNISILIVLVPTCILSTNDSRSSQAIHINIIRRGKAYGRTQRRRPYLTQIISSLIVYGAADISAQSVGDQDYDALRTGRGLVIGAIASIPAYRWFIWLSQSFNYSSRVLSMATRVLVSQSIFTTLFNTYFFGAHALLAGQGLDAAVQRVRDAVPTSWVNSCKLWPLVTVVSLTFVPLEFRSIFTGIIGIGWQTYLSFLNSRAESCKEAVAQDERGEPPRLVPAATNYL
ncbi:Protein sym-1 [Escovopsis weberi]|uniref:Protein sym-1 n=1 Tax=Escovopsis weberi TaxID=150374 RepID=A0A0M8N070_ESCWE|nr:Protein sym-1 [Escovopsis weberi]